MGNVFSGVTNTELRDEFKCCNVYAKEKCQKCFAKFYCSGGCAANSYNFHGSINDAYDIGCELQKKRVECAIMIKAATAGLQTEAEDMRTETEGLQEGAGEACAECGAAECAQG